MPQEFLDRADIITFFKQMGGKTVPERMYSCPFDNSGFLYSFFEKPLQV